MKKVLFAFLLTGILLLSTLVIAKLPQIGTSYHNDTYTEQIRAINSPAMIRLIIAGKFGERFSFTNLPTSQSDAFTMYVCSDDSDYSYYPDCPSNDNIDAIPKGQMWLSWEDDSQGGTQGGLI